MVRLLRLLAADPRRDVDFTGADATCAPIASRKIFLDAL